MRCIVLCYCVCYWFPERDADTYHGFCELAWINLPLKIYFSGHIKQQCNRSVLLLFVSSLKLYTRHGAVYACCMYIHSYVQCLI